MGDDQVIVLSATRTLPNQLLFVGHLPRGYCRLPVEMCYLVNLLNVEQIFLTRL